MRSILTEIGPNDMNQGEKTHDLPRYWNDGEIWTSIREPCEWLASVWAWSMRTGWKRYPPQVPWHYFCNIISDYPKRTFSDWVCFITDRYPGLVGWLYGMYCAPGVEAYKLGPELYGKLEEIGGNPDLFGTIINGGKNCPVIAQSDRDMVYIAEKETYLKYGFPKPEGVTNV